MRQFCIVLLVAVILISCKDIREPELRGIENVKLNGLSLSSSTITLDIKYFNPNPFKAKLKEAEGDAWIDSAYLGHFKVDTLVQVPADSEFLVPVKLAVEMKYMLQHSFSIFRKEEVMIRIAGTAKAGRHGFYRNIPLKYEGRQNLAQLFNSL
jgi:LEA14-like dessication related protein